MLPSSLSRSVNTTWACTHWKPNWEQRFRGCDWCQPSQAHRTGLRESCSAGEAAATSLRTIRLQGSASVGGALEFPLWKKGIHVNPRSTKVIWVVTNGRCGRPHSHMSEQLFRNGEAPYDLECDANSAVAQAPQTVTFLEQRNETVNELTHILQVRVSCTGPIPVVES